MVLPLDLPASPASLPSPALIWPTNAPDVQGVECLLAALEAFTGGVLLVSHDQYLVQASMCALNDDYFLGGGGGGAITWYPWLP